VAVGLWARMGGASEVQGACVHGVHVLVVLEVFERVVTWTVFSNNTSEPSAAAQVYSATGARLSPASSWSTRQCRRR